MSKVIKGNIDQKNLSARRSQRRINKLLQKNISEYEIPNPYRSYRSSACLPQNLSRQLSKLDFLSVRSLQSLQFKQPSAQQEVNQLLLKMRFVVQRQSQEFQIYISQMTQKMKKYSEKTHYQELDKNIHEEEVDQLNDSAYMPKDSQNSIEMQAQDQNEGHLPLVSHQSEGASMMSDNYEEDKLVFHSDRHLSYRNNGYLAEEILQSYQI